VNEPLRPDPIAAVELAECLEFVCDWIDHDRSRLDDSLWRYATGGYRIGVLRDDLNRFAALVHRDQSVMRADVIVIDLCRCLVPGVEGLARP